MIHPDQMKSLKKGDKVYIDPDFEHIDISRCGPTIVNEMRRLAKNGEPITVSSVIVGRDHLHSYIIASGWSWNPAWLYTGDYIEQPAPSFDDLF